MITKELAPILPADIREVCDHFANGRKDDAAVMLAGNPGLVAACALRIKDDYTEADAFRFLEFVARILA